jgi:hypothetical protein
LRGSVRQRVFAWEVWVFQQPLKMCATSKENRESGIRRWTRTRHGQSNSPKSTFRLHRKHQGL